MLEETELDTRIAVIGTVSGPAMALAFVGPIVGATVETGDACGMDRTQVG
jgi:hypothetical protein